MEVILDVSDVQLIVTYLPVYQVREVLNLLIIWWVLLNQYNCHA